MSDGELHEISRTIGGLEQGVKDLGRSFDRHCNDDDRRHEENVATLSGIQKSMDDLFKIVEPLAKAVEVMQPIVNGYQISRWKMTGAISLAGAILTLIGYVFSVVIEKSLHWLVSSIRF